MNVRHEDGTRTGGGLAALAVGTTISVGILFHWLAVDGAETTSHSAVLIFPFFGGLGVAFPDRISRFLQEWKGARMAKEREE